MSALRDKKTLVVDEITKNLKESKCLIVANYKTLNVVSLQKIRQALAEKGVFSKSL